MKVTPLQYYNWRKLWSYDVVLRIIIGGRNLGKTFGIKLKAIKDFLKEGRRFIWVVRTDTMVKKLTSNKGEKFFCRIIDYCRKYPSVNNNSLLRILTGKTLLTNDEMPIEQGKKTLLGSGTIIINSETAGYIVALNDFGDIKGNDYVNVKYIIIDEFIAEKRDIRNLQDPYKLVSVVQSICRLHNIFIVMLTNAVTTSDAILRRLGLNGMKLGQLKLMKDEFGNFGIAHYVDPDEYQKLEEAKDRSVAGRFAKLMGETSLDKNEFKDDVDDELKIPHVRERNSYLAKLKSPAGIVRIHKTVNNIIYCLNDYGNVNSSLIVFNKKWIDRNYRLILPLKDYFIAKYKNNMIRFEDGHALFLFKQALELETKMND